MILDPCTLSEISNKSIGCVQPQNKSFFPKDVKKCEKNDELLSMT